jgi:hypothetical protein
VGRDPEFPDITARDAQAVREWLKVRGAFDAPGPTPTPSPRGGGEQAEASGEFRSLPPRGGGLGRGLGRTQSLGRLSGLGLAVAVVTFAVDQGHKWWMLGPFDIAARQPVRVTPFLDLVLAWNPASAMAGSPRRPMPGAGR